MLKWINNFFQSELWIALNIMRRRLLKTYPPSYQVENAPLFKNITKYGYLFQNSESNFETIITPYTSEFNWSLSKLYNGAFESIDLELYYSMVRRFQPNLIIEIGSGYCTHFAEEAIRKNQVGRIICIDPEPRTQLPKCVELMKAKVEDVGIDMFEKLGEGDILFIDSSHTTKEAKYHIEKILPNLKTGVIIHHHDFFFPYALYHENDPITFGESDVLLKFYREHKDSYEIIVCASYARFRNLKLLRRLIKSYSWNPSRVPGSLWTRKIALKSKGRQ